MKEKIILKTAIIVDPMGHGFGEVGPEEEIEEHKTDFAELLYPAQIKAYTPACMSERDIETGTDLIVFDYGGMMPGNTLMEDNSRRLIQFAQDHSSTLCVIVSTFTWKNAIKLEMRDLELDSLHNVVCRYWAGKCYWEEGVFGEDDKEPDNYDCIPAWFREMYHLPFVEPRDQIGGRWYVDKNTKLRKPRKGA